MQLQAARIPGQLAVVTVHGQVEGRVVVLHEVSQPADAHGHVQLLLNFTDQSLLRRLVRFDFAARELPAPRKISIAPLGGEEFNGALLLPADDGSDYVNCFRTRNLSYPQILFIRKTKARMLQ